jgi:hypothetical protein
MIDKRQLQDTHYDPYGLMPADFPPHPRVLLTPERLARARQRNAAVDWAKLACGRLLQSAAEPFDLPAPWSDPARPAVADALTRALKNAIAQALTHEEKYQAEALRILRAVAAGSRQWAQPAWGAEGPPVPLAQNHLRFFALAYDLLAAGLSAEDEQEFRDVLTSRAQGLDGNPHYFCGNHNTWNIVARLAVGAALGDRQTIHDAFYGCGRNGQWRYGLVHQLQHDLLADGLHWERTLGYHYYTLMACTEIADIAAHLGSDVWHLEVPALMANDGHDLHRDYGPVGVKTFKMLYDAPFYQMFANRDCALLHDSGLANFRGVWIWGILYDLAYQAYGDPKYAWLIDVFEQDYPERKVPGLPMQLQTWAEYYDFIRLGDRAYPGGAFSLAPAARLGYAGRHEKGCSLFPVHGSAILRHDPADERSPGLYLFFGPHSAGHQAPAALHLDLHAGGCRRTDAVQLAGYADPNYLTWARTTIGHNTVTVDETPMYPYGADTESMWEADTWHDRVSDGELLLFQTEDDFKALRARNANVYPGVCLDRTVVLTRAYVLDVFRVLGETERQYDWVLHVLGRVDLPAATAVVDLGQKRGYRHFRNAREWIAPPPRPIVVWQHRGLRTLGHLALPAAARLFFAEDPIPAEGHDLGEFEPPAPRTTVIVRVRAAQTAFASLWSFAGAPRRWRMVETAADQPILLEIEEERGLSVWRFPFAREAVRRTASQT